MSNAVELRPVVGSFRDSDTGKIRKIKWDMDLLLYNGKQIATIDKVPGHPVRLLTQSGPFSASQLNEISEAIAAEREGVPPSEIKLPFKINGEVLDDEDEGEETEVDETGDE